MLKQGLRLGTAAFALFLVILFVMPLTASAATGFPPFLTAAGSPATASQQPDQLAEKVSALPELAFSALYGLLFLYLFHRTIRAERRSLGPGGKERSDYRIAYGFTAGIALSFALRLWIGADNPGYVNDLKTFMYWAQHAYQSGLNGFYREGMFADYPPGYIYVLYAIGAVRDWFGIADSSIGARVLLKLPAMLADLAAGVLLYRYGAARIGQAAAFGLAMLYVWNPAVIVNSAAWGQVDAVFVLIILLSLLAIVRGGLVQGTVLFAAAVLVKPQALIFTPVLLLAYWHKREWRKASLAMLAGAAAFVLLALPFFRGNGGAQGLFDLYTSTLSSYPYATLNAFNLYLLTGGNWAPLEERFLSVPYTYWGNAGIVLATALAAWLSLRQKRGRDAVSSSFFLALVLIATVFLFVTKMHERYMFPALLLCAFAYIQTKDRRMLHLLFGFSVTQFVNVSYVLAFSHIDSHPTADGIAMLCAIANLGLFVYMLVTGYDVYVRGRTLEVAPYTEGDKRLTDEKLVAALYASPSGRGAKPSGRMNKRDWLWMGVITAVYAVVAFVHLGSLQGPTTDWKPSSGGQSFYVDFGESKAIDSAFIFGGVGSGKYKLEFGDTLGSWGQAVEIDHKSGNVFKWNKQQLDAIKARYVKFTVITQGFALHEMAFYAPGSDEPLPIASVNADEAGVSERGSVQALFDEQRLATNKPTFMNGAYFDEIYHARTAYEYIEGINAYENTHPPLGKLIIAIGIKLFGLNTFGWRVAGTVFGIAMLPLMYLFALRLFRKTGYAAIATGLFAADFMHFTQTRIATIDVYGVFFIMLMFYFMLRYRDTDFYNRPLRAALLPLCLSGLFFGIGAASKWIVLYGGAGLAIVLFMTLYERYRQYAAARKALQARYGGNASFGSGETADEPGIEGEEEVLRHAVAEFPRRVWLTLASCVVFFVVIPAIIYALSFIPVLNAKDEGYTLQGLIDEQVHMYEYHSELKATHPYASWWWEWPFMKRPVWYFSGRSIMPPGEVSTISALGNPVIWWSGIFAVIMAIYLSLKRRDKRFYIVWIAYLSQYVPWMLVPRVTFLYHYFAMVPFMILSIVYMMKLLDEKVPRWKPVRNLYIAAAVAMFVMFYPVISGMTAGQAYVTMLRWFQTWVF